MKKISLSTLLMAIIGILCVGTGVAFNAGAGLGNDPIGILYDGIRTVFHLSPSSLGTASNIVNASLTLLLFFIGRRYVNIGTLIYILPYGFAVTIGNHLFSLLFSHQTLFARLLAAGCGCFLVYLGVALYISASIGMDPFNGLAMAIKDILHTEYRMVKVPSDCLLIGIGFLLGGKAGFITLFTAFTAGPSIQFLANCISKKREARQTAVSR